MNLHSKYLKGRNCLWNKFLQFLQIFAKFAKLNLHEKSNRSQFTKYNPCRKKIFFFSFLRISKTYTFTLGSLLINDGHVKNTLQDIKQSRIFKNFQSSLLYPNNVIWNIEKFGQQFHDSHTANWWTNHEKIKIYKTLIKLRFAKINPHKKSTGGQFVKLNPCKMLKKKMTCKTESTWKFLSLR